MRHRLRQRQPVRLRPLAALLAIAACSAESPPPAPTTSGPAPAVAAAERAAAVDPDRPRLVVWIVLDQLPAWALTRHWNLLDPDGALHRGATRGRRFVASYPYSCTMTAPGHATLATGVLPAQHGIVNNGPWSAARAAELSVFDDSTPGHEVYGRVNAFASPTPLRSPTVADQLDAATDGRSKIVALSHKDRGTIALAGRRPDVAVWYDRKVPGFTSSGYYGLPPRWLLDVLRDRPLWRLLVPWTVPDPDRLAAALGPDDVAGEAAPPGYGRVFPHDVGAAAKPWAELRSTPQLGEYLIDLAAIAAEREGLGADADPDLLVLAISSTDYAGHTWGPESWEYVDVLRRVDRALGRLITELEARGPVAVVITSDHGATPLPGTPTAVALAAAEPGSPKPGYPGRLVDPEVAADLEAALDRQLGAGAWIARVVAPYVFLGVDGEGPRRAAAEAAVVAALEARPDVALAVAVSSARSWAVDPDPMRRLVGACIAEGEGDVLFVPAPGSVFDPEEEGGGGTAHGGPWTYDREVPVVMWGAGITPGPADPTIVDIRRVASTVAALLGVAPPAADPAAPLPR